MNQTSQTVWGFSLVEVVLALGVIAFAIVAILGIVPIGLRTSHDAQDDTRAAQIAQAVIATIASQAKSQFTNVRLTLNDQGPTAISIDLTTNRTVSLDADKDGKLIPSGPNGAYKVTIEIADPPANFDSVSAKQIGVIVSWPVAAAPINQSKRSFIRIVSKY